MYCRREQDCDTWKDDKERASSEGKHCWIEIRYRNLKEQTKCTWPGRTCLFYSANCSAGLHKSNPYWNFCAFDTVHFRNLFIPLIDFIFLAAFDVQTEFPIKSPRQEKSYFLKLFLQMKRRAKLKMHLCTCVE